MRAPKQDKPFSVERRALMLGSAAGLMLSNRRVWAQSASVLNIAPTSGDPGPLDPTPVTSDPVVGDRPAHCERMYPSAKDFSISATAGGFIPEISVDGKRYVIKLRSGVPFHDGTTMNADDVVSPPPCSQWGRLSPPAHAMGFP